MAEIEPGTTRRFTPFTEGVTTLHLSINETLRQRLDAEARRRNVNRSSLVRSFIVRGLAASRRRTPGRHRKPLAS